MATARETLAPLTFVPGWAALAVVVVPVAAGLALPPVLQYAPLVASALVLGLPHGAVDHLAVARTRGRPLPQGSVPPARAIAFAGSLGRDGPDCRSIS